MIQYTLLSGLMAGFILNGLPTASKDLNSSAEKVSCTIEQQSHNCVADANHADLAMNITGSSQTFR